MLRPAVCLVALWALSQGPVLAQSGGGHIDFSDSSFTGDNGGPPPIEQDGPDLSALPQAVWVAIGGEQAGPFDPGALVELVEAGQLDPDTKVWMNGMSGWAPAGQVAALAPLFATPAPEPEPEPPALAVYVAVGGEAQGPFDAAALATLAAEGTLLPGTQVWMEGMPAWAPAGDVPEIAALLGPPSDDTVDPLRLLVGTWRASGELDLGEVGTGTGTVTVSFASDRTYSLDADVLMQYLGEANEVRTTQLLMRGSGRWQGEAERNGLLFVEVQGTATYSAPELGVAEETGELDEALELRLVDEDTLHDLGEDITYRRVGG